MKFLTVMMMVNYLQEKISFAIFERAFKNKFNITFVE